MSSDGKGEFASLLSLTDPGTTENLATMVVALLVVLFAAPLLHHATKLLSSIKGLRNMSALSLSPVVFFRFALTSYQVWEVLVGAVWLAVVMYTLNDDDWPTRLGELAAANMALVMLPAERVSFLSLFGFSFERTIKAHRNIGYGVVILTTLHLVGFLVEWIPDGLFVPYLFRFKYLMGYLAFILLSLMFATSLEVVRRRFFELFYYTHFAFIAVVVLSCLHSPPIVFFLLPGFALWCIEIGVRLFRWRKSALVNGSVADTGGIVKLIVPRSAKSVDPGAYYFLNIPQVSKLQFHPFTVAEMTSTSLTFFIKPYGGQNSWTNVLSRQTSRTVSVSLDGPYGRLSYPPSSYKTIVIVAGGIGITPMLSLLQGIADSASPTPSRVVLVWTVRKAKEQESMLRCLEQLVERKSSTSYRVLVHVTGKGEMLSTGSASISVHHGRPNVSAVLTAVRHHHKSERRVAVYICGPALLAAVSRDAAYALCSSLFGFRFDVHVETFSF